MNAVFEGRRSDSPYIEMVWRGWWEGDYSPTCPADSHWNLLISKRNQSIKVSVEGPTDQAIFKNQFGGSEFLVIKFRLGTFMPYFPVRTLLNGDALLPEAASKSFWLHGAAWQLPTYDNAEVFVERLVHEGTLVVDPLIHAALQDQPQDVSFRTVRRRFLQSTGLTQGTIRQIERAKQAASLLEQGVPILDVVYEAGYADQPHLTRAIKRFYGQTPAQIARTSQPEE